MVMQANGSIILVLVLEVHSCMGRAWGGRLHGGLRACSEVRGAVQQIGQSGMPVWSCREASMLAARIDSRGRINGADQLIQRGARRTIHDCFRVACTGPGQHM
jgi:hypothetical protein